MNLRLATLLVSCAVVALSTATALPQCNCVVARPLTPDCKLICSGQTPKTPLPTPAATTSTTLPTPVVEIQLPGAPTNANATLLPDCNCAVGRPLTPECKAICSGQAPLPTPAATTTSPTPAPTQL